MKVDYVFMNPPYSLGGKITTEAKKHANRTVCLMPLSCYKKKSDELWRYVESMDLADPKMFEDAVITNNLCICTLGKETVDVYKCYEDMEMGSYNLQYSVFYRKNKVMPKYFTHLGNLVKKDGVTFEREKTFIYLLRTAVHGCHKTGYDVEYNTTNQAIGEIPTLCSGQYQYFFLDMKTNKAKENLATFWYKGELMDKLLWGLNKCGGTCEPAIPQIDWEGISDHPLWKEGKYDEAVLDVMGLKWDGDVIVGK